MLTSIAGQRKKSRKSRPFWRAMPCCALADRRGGKAGASPVRAVLGDLVVDRKRHEQRHENQDHGRDRRKEARGEKRDAGLVTEGREIIDPGQAHDLPPFVSRVPDRGVVLVRALEQPPAQGLVPCCVGLGTGVRRGDVLLSLGGFGFLYVLWAVTRGRGMGFGDVKLAFLMGLFLGFPGIITAFYTAFLTGAIVGVILILTGSKGWKSKIAFGPFLILGMAVTFVWGPQILLWWQNFI